MNFVSRNYVSALEVYIRIMADINVNSFNIHANNIFQLWMQSIDETNIRTLNIQDNGRIAVYDGMVGFKNIGFAGNVNMFIFAKGENGSPHVCLSDKLSFNGTTQQGTVSASNGGTFHAFANFINITGSVTGRRYTLYRGSRILTDGIGANLFPGTQEGYKDATCIYI